MSYSPKMKQLIRPNILKMEAYQSARDTFDSADENVVLLDANENPNDSGYNRYPDPYQKRLRDRLATKYSLAPNRLMLGNGSDEILDLLIRAICEPGLDQCLVLPPTYGMYRVLSDLNNVEMLEVPLDVEFQPIPDDILKSAKATTKILFLCSPNNPTGNLLATDRVEYLLRNFNGLVVIDEAYIDFANRPSWVMRLEEFENLVVIQTLSKAYGMAGLRLGICYGQPWLISLLQKIKAPYNINSATQQLALQRLNTPETIKAEVDELITQRERLATALEEIAWVRSVYPSQANFLLVGVDDASLRYKQALGSGFVLRNRDGLPGCDQCIRISIGTPSENNLLIEQLKQLK